ncbi:MAG: transposase [Chloroflexi bacterium]|nr:transposase [Chloroflexota bacterium]MBU1662394.1 transposase [Chloroflexota bacterium]
MSNNHRVYRSIRNATKQFYPNKPEWNLARQSNPLAELATVIAQSNRRQLPAIAWKFPVSTKPESQVTKYCCRIQNELTDLEIHYLPFVREFLAALADIRTLVLVMDDREVGHNCPALMLSVVYKGRTLPIAWIVAKGSHGNYPAANHAALVHKAHQLIPAGADVIFLDDMDLDSTPLQTTIKAYGWAYVCRAAEDVILQEDGVEFSFKDLMVTPGDCLSLPQVLLAQQGYRPVHAIARWQKGCQEPLYLITNLELAEEACYWYARRLRIETFFSDEKSRGFHIHKSHLSDPDRLAHLMIAACLTYIWIIYLGV